MHSQAQNTLPNTPKNTNNKAGLAIINSKAPYSSYFGKDALDVALIFGSYEQKVSLFFKAMAYTNLSLSKIRVYYLLKII
jgi:tRNA 2-thiouridine synthesizing protein C